MFMRACVCVCACVNVRACVHVYALVRACIVWARACLSVVCPRRVCESTRMVYGARACACARALAWGSVHIHVFILRSKIPSADKEVGVQCCFVTIIILCAADACLTQREGERERGGGLLEGSGVVGGAIIIILCAWTATPPTRDA